MAKHQDTNSILQPRAVVVGPQVSRVSIDINKRHKAVRVGFHPGGLFRLLGIPMKEMVDESYDAQDIFGSRIAQLNEQLQEADSFDTIYQLTEQFLLEHVSSLKSTASFDLAMLKLLSEGGNCSVEALASFACVSLRQFERISHDRIGFSPKFFSRITRFSRAYRMREKYPSRRWTDIAHACAYYDQMHMIRDFKQFTGASPLAIEQELRSTALRLQAELNL